MGGPALTAYRGRMIEPLWTTVFIDVPAESHPAAQQFWAGVTGNDVTPAWGPEREFSTLQPPQGDAYLGVQRIGSGGPGVHPDLHVSDIEAAAREAEGIGAIWLHGLEGIAVLRSPGGLAFCLVGPGPAHRPAPTEWAESGRSFVDQICLDAPSAVHDVEAEFWGALVGWEIRGGVRSAEYSRFDVPDHLPVLWLLQRLEEDEGPVRAHLDLSADDREAETRRHVRLGATVLDTREWWTVLHDPAGAAYCITDREPGVVPG